MAQSLDELIPDEAVESPEEWAEGGKQGSGSPVREAVRESWPELTSPVSESADLDWLGDGEIDLPVPLEPEEMPAIAEFEPESVEAATEIEVVTISSGLEVGVPSNLADFPERDEFLRQFVSRSTIKKLESSDDNLAQLALRARKDEELLNDLLRFYGYYNANLVRSAREADDEGPAQATQNIVRFEIFPGKQFEIGAVDLRNLEATGGDYEELRAGFEIYPGDPVLSEKITAEHADLEETLGEKGYPFASVGEPSLLVDLDRSEADLTVPVEPGGKYRFGEIVSLQPDFLSSRHLTSLARFEPGEIYKESGTSDLRRAILDTGLVSSVQITPRETITPAGDTPGVTDIDIDMAEAPLRSIAVGAGYGTDEGYQVFGSWEHRNLFPPEGMLRLRGLLGTNEQLVGMTFRRNNLGGRDRSLTFDLSGDNEYRNAYRARTGTLSATYEKKSTILYQKRFSWGLGAEAVVTDESEKKLSGEKTPRKTYKVGALPFYGLFDTTTDLLDPVSGFKLGLQLSPEVSLQGDNAPVFLRGRLDAAAYLQAGGGTVLAVRGAVGTIVGVDLVKVAPSRRLYAGGGNSIRGYGYESIGRNNDPDKPNGGRSLVEFSIEARVPTGIFDDRLSFVPFLDGGAVGPDSVLKFDRIRFGAGLGVRYKSDIGPLRLDVATPLNPRAQDGSIAVYASLGQAF